MCKNVHLALTKVVPLVGLVGLSLLMACLNAVSWSALPDERLTSVRVGAPVQYKCCVKGTYEKCQPLFQPNSNCVANPNCVAGGQETKGTCKGAYCTPAPSNYYCGDPPDEELNYTASKCAMSGKALDCTNPPGTKYCEFKETSYTEKTKTGCVLGLSLCDAQPFRSCE